MDNVLIVYILETSDDAGDEEPYNVNQAILTGLLLGKTAMPTYVVTQVASSKQIHHEVQIFAILECIVHVDQERILQLCEDLALIHY